MTSHFSAVLISLVLEDRSTAETIPNLYVVVNFGKLRENVESISFWGVRCPVISDISSISKSSVLLEIDLIVNDVLN